MILEFIRENLASIISFILTGIAGYLGIVCKRIYQKYVDNKTIESVAKTAVKAVEQIYKDLHGDEKLQRALESASEMLENRGIHITELELRMQIEAAVCEFNDAFAKTKAIEEE